MPTGKEGDMSFTSCLYRVQAEDEIWGMWCGVSPPAPWGSLQGGKGKLNLLVWWKHIQAPSTAADYHPYVVLRYINSAKGNSFQRRVCSCNFSQNSEENTVCMTLVRMCASLSTSFCLQRTQEFADLSAKEDWLAGQGGTDPSFIFSIATAQK